MRKSFHGALPVAIKTPILLETSGAERRPLRIDTMGMTTGLWKPDYHGDGYGDLGERGVGEDQVVERVRQGSKARRVEVIDSPSLEGMEARVSNVGGGGGGSGGAGGAGEDDESPERRINGRGKKDEKGGIVLF